jgi:hypothetical protein
MSRIFPIAALLAFLFATGTVCTSCKKSVSVAAVNSPTGRYPIFTRDGDTLGFFKIHGDNKGDAIVTFENLQSWMFTPGASYEVGFYNGPTVNDLFSALKDLTANTATWTTHPVKEQATGNIVTAERLVKITGLKLSISAPSEVVGIGNVQ